VDIRVSGTCIFGFIAYFTSEPYPEPYPTDSSECGFYCWDGKCIPGHWMCDGIADCDGREDEQYCGGSESPGPEPVPTTERPWTPSKSFRLESTE